MRDMPRIVFTAYIAFFVYLLLTAIFGETGFFAFKKLDNYKNRLTENIGKLEAINESLIKECEALVDPELIKLKARDMGIIAEDEKIIINDLGEKKNSYSLGSICRRDSEDRSDTNVYIRAASLIIALSFSLFSYIIDIKDGIKNRRRRDFGNCVGNSAE